MTQDAKDAVDATEIISSSTATCRQVITSLADAGEITGDVARAFRAVLSNIDDAAIVLASRVASPEMFAERTE